MTPSDFGPQYTTLPHNADGTGSGIPYAGDADGNFAYSYTYQATPINGTDFKAVQYVASADGSTRTVYNRHGIKIYVVFGMKIKRLACFPKHGLGWLAYVIVFDPTVLCSLGTLVLSIYSSHVTPFVLPRSPPAVAQAAS